MAEIAEFSSKARVRMAAYWAATSLVVMELGLGGAWDLLRVPQVRSVMERLEYPSYVLLILGVWKLPGAVVLLIPRFPRLKEWAYAGAMFDLSGAIASHGAVGYLPSGTMVYLILMMGLTGASWTLRPGSRRL